MNKTPCLCSRTHVLSSGQSQPWNPRLLEAARPMDFCWSTEVQEIAASKLHLTESHTCFLILQRSTSDLTLEYKQACRRCVLNWVRHPKALQGKGRRLAGLAGS